MAGVPNADAAQPGLLLYPDPARPATGRAERRRRRATGWKPAYSESAGQIEKAALGVIKGL